MMDRQTTFEEEAIKSKKYARRCVISFTVLYAVLFPFLFYMAMLSSMVFDNPHMTTTRGLSIIFTTFCVPLSIPISIYLMWSRYFREQYKKSSFFCAIPLLTFLVVFLVLDVFPLLLANLGF